VVSGEATNTNFLVIGFTRSWLKPTIYHTWGEHLNHYTNDAVKQPCALMTSVRSLNSNNNLFLELYWLIRYKLGDKWTSFTQFLSEHMTKFILFINLNRIETFKWIYGRQLLTNHIQFLSLGKLAINSTCNYFPLIFKKTQISCIF
jgi:hypothetical protein